MAKKPVITAKEAAAMIPNGATIMCGGLRGGGQGRASVQGRVGRGPHGQAQRADRQRYGPCGGPQGRGVLRHR